MHNQDIERDAGLYREWYDQMLEVENKMYDEKAIVENFYALPDNIINNFIEYLNWLKIEFLKLSTWKAEESRDLVYRKWLFTATTKFLEMFSTVRASRDQWISKVDKITWMNVQDKIIQEAIKKQEGKNI